MAEFQPCFVVGNERSGTTLLAVLLGRHSQLAVTPETHFFRLVPRRGAVRGLAHAVLLEEFMAMKETAALRLDRQRLAERYARYAPTHADLFRAVLEEFAASQNKPRAGEKTPFHLLNVPQIFEWFPQARVIAIVRDGRDVVLSLLRMPWSEENRLRPLCMRWNSLVRVAEKHQQAFPDRFLMIRYEDLLTGPEATLRRIDAFAGLEFEPGQLDPRVPTHIVDAATEAWKADAVEKIDPTRIAAWKNKVTPQQRLIMNTLMGPDLARLGYTDFATPDVTPIARLGNALTNSIYLSGLFRLWHHAIERNLPAARARRHEARGGRSG